MKKLNYKKEFGAGVEKVWNALVNAEALGTWFMPTNFEASVGAEFYFAEPGLKVNGAVLEVIEHQKLSYIWISQRDDEEGEAGTPSIVTWNLSPTEAGGTCLQLEHELLEAPEPVVLIESALNWQFAIHCSLPDFLRDKYRQPVPIVYAPDDEPNPESQARRAGFRQATMVNA